jgi:AraC-like DNA-binding protein
MQDTSNWFFSFVFLSSALGVIVACILLFINRTDTFQSKLLAWFLVSISLFALIYGLMFTSFYLTFPHMWRAFGWVGFVYEPLCFVYVRSVLEQSYRFKKWDFLFLLPAVLYNIHLFPFIILPREVKLEFVQRAITDTTLIMREPEGLMPDGWGPWARLLINAALVFTQFIMLLKWKHRIFNEGASIAQNKYIFKWLSLVTGIMGLFYTLVFFQFTAWEISALNLIQGVALTVSLTILFICISLLIRPSILYGLTGWMQGSVPVAKLPDAPVRSEDELPTQRKSTLTISQGKEYKDALEEHFSRNKPYLKQGYKIGDLANELNISYHQLSAFINQEYGKNFNELVNEYRVDHLVDLARTDIDLNMYTLEALGKKAGFNSRVAFIAAVKKRTHKTPSELFGRKEESES